MTKMVIEGRNFYLFSEDEYDIIRQQLREDSQRMMKRTDIAKMLGISPQRLSECPWLLPYNGKGMRHKRNATWSEREVMMWHRKTPEQLRAEYDASA